MNPRHISSKRSQGQNYNPRGRGSRNQNRRNQASRGSRRNRRSRGGRFSRRSRQMNRARLPQQQQEWQYEQLQAPIQMFQQMSLDGQSYHQAFGQSNIQEDASMDGNEHDYEQRVNIALQHALAADMVGDPYSSQPQMTDARFQASPMNSSYPFSYGSPANLPTQDWNKTPLTYSYQPEDGANDTNPLETEINKLLEESRRVERLLKTKRSQPHVRTFKTNAPEPVGEASNNQTDQEGSFSIRLAPRTPDNIFSTRGPFEADEKLEAMPKDILPSGCVWRVPTPKITTRTSKSPPSHRKINEPID